MLKEIMMAHPKAESGGGVTPQLSPDLAPDCKGPPATEEEMRGAVLGVKREKLVKGRRGTQNKCRIVKMWGFIQSNIWIYIYPQINISGLHNTDGFVPCQNL